MACAVNFCVGLGGLAVSEIPTRPAPTPRPAARWSKAANWLMLHFNYANRFEKPIPFYWIVLLSYLVSGVSEFAARAGAALSGLGLVLLTAWVARR